MKSSLQRNLLIAAVLLFLGGGLFLLRKQGPRPAPTEAVPTGSPSVVTGIIPQETQSFGPRAQGSRSPLDSASRDQKSRESLETMSRLLAKAFNPSTTLEEVVSELKKTGQKPFVTRSENPATGRMMIVRTKSPLPGTRYFHAQYFTDEQNKVFVQHMSFEFKPGPDSLREAVQTAMRSFRLGQPREQKADFLQWDLDDDYVLWIKRKSAEDLTDDPFNAYDPEKDDGTVQVAMEMKIHGDAEEGHEH
ncbi:MAG TPA: hypothetical protein PL182_08495 [Pseudobdellovibrionaceae bacterium]|nr:hypothetical protein [Pseudobdellovibrionaceae bacterium]